MPETLIDFLDSRAETGNFLLPDLALGLESIFSDVSLLPRPYRIYLSDESKPPVLGFPIAQSSALEQLDRLVEAWMEEEVQALQDPGRRERLQAAFQRYLTHTLRLAENALLSNLLADYHAVFWLAHSTQLARRFCELPRRVSSASRGGGETIKYRTFAKWSNEMREQMIRMSTKLQPILDGEEARGLEFFRLIQDNVLLITEEYIAPELRELRSYIAGYLQRDAQQFRGRFEDLLHRAGSLLESDPLFRNACRRLVRLPAGPSHPAMIIDRRFRDFLLEHPTLQGWATPEELDQMGGILRRVGEFAVLNQLRRGMIPITSGIGGEYVSADDPSIIYSRSTRPIDFGRPGVVDPMVHRFGLMYDITAFSETLGDIARTGQKGEMNSYRQMLLFQRKLESITERHRLQFEKFLGDGAFYTTRRALRLLQAAVEIQRFYAEMRRRGFAFNKGLRIAVNYGYYRLLPTQKRPDSNERVMEFYGPGVVELSRLTTGKTTKEIEELEAFLISHGYEASAVRKFFAPIARGADMIDQQMHQREFYAYVNANGHLVNEGMVASMTFIEELAQEIAEESIRVARLETDRGVYLGIPAMVEGIDWIGLCLIGHVSLKGLARTEVAEIVTCRAGETDVSDLAPRTSIVQELRQIFHDHAEPEPAAPSHAETRETEMSSSILICSAGGTGDPLIMMGEWDPSENALRRSIRLAGSDLQRLLGIETPLRLENIERRKDSLQELYVKMAAHDNFPVIQLGPFRQRRNFIGFVLGEHVERI
ncbi:MAG TPA: hypothetical protein VM534_08340 [Thermoanaerobaculia bacterium]|nr:hypothetical protein [Thermoanaerobaculia bacterium]